MLYVGSNYPVEQEETLVNHKCADGLVMEEQVTGTITVRKMVSLQRRGPSG